MQHVVTEKTSAMLQKATISKLGFVVEGFFQVNPDQKIDQLGWQIFVLLEKT